jgi:hypothetical protein
MNPGDGRVNGARTAEANPLHLSASAGATVRQGKKLLIIEVVEVDTVVGGAGRQDRPEGGRRRW